MDLIHTVYNRHYAPDLPQDAPDSPGPGPVRSPVSSRPTPYIELYLRRRKAHDITVAQNQITEYFDEPARDSVDDPIAEWHAIKLAGKWPNLANMAIDILSTPGMLLFSLLNSFANS